MSSEQYPLLHGLDRWFEWGITGILLLQLLIPVWRHQLFLTCDGPCHLYNAAVLLDVARSHDIDHYQSYYLINKKPNPNWSSHILFIVLLGIFPYWLSEKLFITGYIFLFFFAFRSLLLLINPANRLLVFLGVPFIFTFYFQMGYFGFCLSVAVFFIAIHLWLRMQAQPTFRCFLGFAILLLILFFTHPVGYGLSLALTGLFLLARGIRVSATRSLPIRQKIKTTGGLFALWTIAHSIPFSLLTSFYSPRITAYAHDPLPVRRLLQNFTELTSLKTLGEQEAWFPYLLAILIGVLTLHGLWQKCIRRQIHIHDVFIVAAVCIILLLLFAPKTLAGGGMFNRRLQFVPYLLIILWLSSFSYSRRVKWTIALSALVLNTTLFLVRYPMYERINQALQEYLSCAPYIKEKSTLLPLIYNHYGKTPEGEVVVNRTWIFSHAADYIGIEKRLIMFDNYEAHQTYFPLSWIPERNPYWQISIGNGIDASPPYVNFVLYEARTGGRVDYVLLWCMDSEVAKHPHSLTTKMQLDEFYTCIFTSANGLAKLYQLKKLITR